MTGLIVDSTGLTLSAGGLLLETGLGSATLTQGGGVWGEAQLTAYLASLSDGLFYDAAELDRYFQESAGPTLADDVGEAIGLGLDQRTWGGQTLAQVAAAATEKVTNPNFDADVLNWSQQGSGDITWTWVAGVGRMVRGAGGVSGYPGQSISVVAGRLYRVECAVKAGSATINFRVGTSTGGNDLLAGTDVTAGTTVTRYFSATGSTAGIAMWPSASNTTVDIDSVSVKEIAGRHALQATGASKPTRQTSGVKFDGTDDNLLTTYYAGSGSNFIVALVTIPASIPVAQVVIGAFGGGADRSFLGVNTSGFAYLGLGSLSGGVQVGTTDIRGTETVIGLSFDGSTARIFVGSSMEYSGAQSGSPTTTVPYRLGALNSSGTAFNFFAGSIKKIVAGREHLTLARYLQIRAALLA